jgi:hypothetical protein
MLAAGLAVLAVFPAGALANTSRAKVLSADARHHSVQLVDSTHVVRAYRLRGTMPHLSLGDTVTFRRAGRSNTISHVKRTARAFGTLSFYAKVVRSGSAHVRLRLADGRALRLSASQVSTSAVAHADAVPAAAHAAPASTAPVTIQVQGLTPGETVLISETVDAQGHWTITLTLPRTTPGAGGTAGGGTGDGSGDDPGDDPDDGQLAEGAITQVSATGLAISTASGPLSFAVDPTAGLTDGFLIGDVVDVTYDQSSDGSLSADDVEYVEQDEAGVVTAVSDGGLTLTDQATGQPDSFVGDPDVGLFDGVNPGDQVDVTYHQAAAGDVADAVDDEAWDN